MGFYFIVLQENMSYIFNFVLNPAILVRTIALIDFDMYFMLCDIE